MGDDKSYKTNSIVLLFLFFPLLIGTAMAIDKQQSESTPNVEKVVQFTDTTTWSNIFNDIKLRVIFNSNLNLYDPIGLKMELEDIYPVVNSSSTNLSRVIHVIRATLRLTNMNTGYTREYNLPNPISATRHIAIIDTAVFSNENRAWNKFLSFKVDCDPRLVDIRKCNRGSVFCWQIPPRDTVHESLPAGQYGAQLELFIRDESNIRGVLISPIFTFRVNPSDEEQIEYKFAFPKNFRLSRGPLIDWDYDDMDTIRITKSPGRLFQSRILSEYGDLLTPGTPQYPSIQLNPELPMTYHKSNLIMKPDVRPVFVDGLLNVRLHFELIESAVAPGRGCNCRLFDSFTKLWEKDLEVGLTRAQYDSLTLNQTELYEIHTLIVPTRLHLDNSDSLYFTAADMMLQELRIPRRHSILMNLIFNDSINVWIPRLPGFLICESADLPNIPAFNSIKINIYAIDSANHGQIGKWEIPEHLIIWSTEYKMDDKADVFTPTGDLAKTSTEPWPFRTYYLPRQLKLTKDNELVRVPGDSIELAFSRCPGTVLFAALCTGGECITKLRPDLSGPPVIITTASIRGDTLNCKLDLYELPVGSRGSGSYTALWSYNYSIPVSKSQVKKLLRRMREWERPFSWSEGTRFR